MAPKRDAFGRRATPARAILEEVNLVATGSYLETKPLQITVPQELVRAARANHIHRALGDFGQHVETPAIIQQSPAITQAATSGNVTDQK